MPAQVQAARAGRRCLKTSLAGQPPQVGRCRDAGMQACARGRSERLINCSRSGAGPPQRRRLAVFRCSSPRPRRGAGVQRAGRRVCCGSTCMTRRQRQQVPVARPRSRTSSTIEASGRERSRPRVNGTMQKAQLRGGAGRRVGRGGSAGWHRQSEARMQGKRRAERSPASSSSQQQAALPSGAHAQRRPAQHWPAQLAPAQPNLPTQALPHRLLQPRMMDR